MLLSVRLLLIITLTHYIDAHVVKNKYEKYLKNPSVERFRKYLQIDTSKEANLKYALDFLVREATSLGLPYSIYQPAGKPIFVATLKGSNPKLPSIMLNSHMDVVTVDETEWTYPPFEAHMDSNGDIYARGTQDTKDIGIQYLEAIRMLKKKNVTLLRTIHVTFMPDEETGGKNGMIPFIKTPEFKALNIGFALDEGMPAIENSLMATFVDKRPLQLQFVLHGEGGHGSTLKKSPAVEKVNKLMNAVMDYRAQQAKIEATKSATDFTGYTSVNINIINGGLATNIIPTKFTLVVDMRLAPEADPVQMEALVKSWIQTAGNDTEVTYVRQLNKAAPTSVDNKNPYWITMRNTLNNMGLQVKPVVLPASSDMLYVRNIGIPAIGFSTKTNTTFRAHAKDEYQNVVTFLKGIEIYTKLIKNIGCMP